MARWFRDWCAVFSFIHEDHPWHLDYSARVIISFDENTQERKRINDLRMKRIKEIKDNDTGKK